MSLFNIGFAIFPDLTQLDFTGPLQVLSRLPHSTTHIVAKSETPVPSDCGLGLVPTHTFANGPPPQWVGLWHALVTPNEAGADLQEDRQPEGRTAAARAHEA